MTFARFQEIFASKYPDGEVWMHDVFEHGQRGKRQKVAVVFKPNSKVYMYAGAYEDVLYKVGINCISKERLAEAEIHLKDLKKSNGKPDPFFGFTIDNSKEIEALEKQIEQYKTEWVIG